MDLHTKKIVGYAFDKSLTTNLIIRTLNNAIVKKEFMEVLVLYQQMNLIAIITVFVFSCKNNVKF